MPNPFTFIDMDPPIEISDSDSDDSPTIIINDSDEALISDNDTPVVKHPVQNRKRTATNDFVQMQNKFARPPTTEDTFLAALNLKFKAQILASSSEDDDEDNRTKQSNGKSTISYSYAIIM